MTRDQEAVRRAATPSRQPEKAVASLKRAHVQTVLQPTGTPGELLRLQRQYGNRYVQHVIHLWRQTSGSMKGEYRVHGPTRKLTSQGQVRIDQQITGNRRPIQCWGSADHEKISTEAAQGIIEDPLFVYQVAQSSSLMDFTTKRLLWTGPLFLLGITKGEGPEHGEDGNYSHTNVAAATAHNLQAQNSHLNRAAEYRRQAKALERQGRPVHEIGSLHHKMFRELGDACHIAQDRGSHGEVLEGQRSQRRTNKIRMGS